MTQFSTSITWDDEDFNHSSTLGSSFQSSDDDIEVLAVGDHQPPSLDHIKQERRNSGIVSGGGVFTPELSNFESIYEECASVRSRGSKRSSSLRRLSNSVGSDLGRSVSKKMLHVRRHSSDDRDETATVGLSSLSKSSYYSSSGSSNIWSKMLGGGSEQLWDSLNGKKGVLEDYDDYEEDDLAKSNCLKEMFALCTSSMSRCGLRWWYETRLFLRTLGKHPLILVTTLLVFGVLCGLGIFAVEAQKDWYVEKQMNTAESVVS